MQKHDQDMRVDNPRILLLEVRPPALRQGLWRVAGAGVVAAVMVSAFTTTAFAKSTSVDGRMTQSVASQQVDSRGQEEEERKTANNAGVVVVAVDEAGPAAQAGIMRGDLLLEVGSVTIDSAATLFSAVTGAKAGEEIAVVVQHGDEQRTVSVILGQLGDRPYLGVQVVDPPGAAGTVQSAGEPVAIDEADTEEADTEEADTKEVVTETVTLTESKPAEDVVLLAPGLMVAEVLADSPAGTAGLAAGDLIFTIDGKSVATPEALREVLQSYVPGDVVLLMVQKGGPIGAALVDVPVTLGSAPDDPSQAYLGIRFVAMPADVKVDAPPVVEQQVAPAVPVAPGVPVPPDAGAVYAYPGMYTMPYAGPPAVPYVDPYAMPYAVPTGMPVPPGTCGVANVTIYNYGGMPGYAAPFNVPLTPFVQAQPVTPPAPYFIYHQGVQPEVYYYGAMTSEQVAGSAMPGQDVVLVPAQPQANWTMAAPSIVMSHALPQPVPGEAPVLVEVEVQSWY